MLEALPSYLAPIVILALGVYLVVRLGLLSIRDIAGRYPFILGLSLLVLSSLWHAITAVSGYRDWFVDSAYPVLNLLKAMIGGIGLLLLTIGLVRYAGYWKSRHEDLEVREGKLSLLEDLQHAARQPFQLLELLNMVLREILYHSPAFAGVVFLFNRSRRQFVLATSTGLDKKEIASLEKYSFGNNLASQALELGNALIGGRLSDAEPPGVSVLRARSTLVLPMVSGNDQIGVVMLLAEGERQFSRAEIRYLSPVSEWLAERIRNTRLTRELALARSKVEHRQNEQEEMLARLAQTGRAISSANDLDAFCQALVGLAGSESVHLIGLYQGMFKLFGGSEPMTGLSEGYRTALINALDRDKPLIINQEAADSNGRGSSLLLSSLVVPIDDRDRMSALLFRRTTTPFKVGEQDLKVICTFGQLGRTVIKQKENKQIRLSHRKGIECVLRLLRTDQEIRPFDDHPEYLGRVLSPLLGDRAQLLTFSRKSDGSLHMAGDNAAMGKAAESLTIAPGEGELGKASSSALCRFVAGKASVQASFNMYEPHNEQLLQRLMGERDTPSFLAACPVLLQGRVAGVVLVLVFEIDESESGEWERLLTLVTRLYSLRLSLAASQTMDGMDGQRASIETISGATLNRINNHLTAVVGAAQLAANRQDISGSLRDQLNSIVTEAERAAKATADAFHSAVQSGQQSEQGGLQDVLVSVLRESHISADLYMIGGRAREVHLDLTDDDRVAFPSLRVRKLFESVLARFGSLADDDDIISIVSYRKGNALYLDVSRHRKNFPPVDRVSDFGRYLAAGEALKIRPADIFLEEMADENCQYAVDRTSAAPAYLSFRLPIRIADDAETAVKPESIRLLAIDDHPVILDLVQAMGHSLGYAVDAASNGHEGIRMAKMNRYDVVLTDLAMPDLSGIETARQIHELAPATPIILVTGWETDISKSELEAAGIRSILYKPFRIEQLTEVVESAAAVES